jgi:hypothetical protein
VASRLFCSRPASDVIVGSLSQERRTKERVNLIEHTLKVALPYIVRESKFGALAVTG